MDRLRQEEWLGGVAPIVDLRSPAVHALRHVCVGAGVVDGGSASIGERRSSAANGGPDEMVESDERLARAASAAAQIVVGLIDVVGEDIKA